MDQNNNNFMDSRTLWAILLVGLVWFGWQQYINKKYGPTQAVAESITESGDSKAAAAPLTELSGSVKSKADQVPAVANDEVQSPEKRLSFENEVLRIEISSKGMSLKNIALKRFKAREGGDIQFQGGDKGILGSTLEGKELDFTISEESKGRFIGVAKVGNVSITKKLTFSSDYRIGIEARVEDPSATSLPSLQLSIEDNVKELSKGSVFSPPTESQEVVVVNNEEQKDFNLAGMSDPLKSEIKQSYLMGISSHYFTAAFFDQSDLVPFFSISHLPTDKTVRGVLNYSAGLGRNAMAVKGIGYVGPKDVSVLESVDPVFLKLIKFGFFSAIAKPLLITMKWINGFVGNWGFAIIILTLLVRMVVMPLHIMSFRSMKAMQKVQPLITNLREKYKEDPMTLNREMMDLMKKHKVNPMGGCLPMLLQIPVFFALYRVFSESIELYQAPFIFWINDLSIKDPFFVLPVLMAVVMYLQQKLTPSTMDPAQAKVMQFMPLLFSFMMISLPSALTLYMFVSTFFGILQQYLFLKDKASVLAVKQAN